MSDFVQLIQTFGLAVAMLVVLGTFLWRVLLWLKPWAEKAIQSHINLVVTTAETVTKLGNMQEQQTSTLRTISNTQQKQTELAIHNIEHLENIWRATEKGNRLLQEHHKLAEQMAKVVMPEEENNRRNKGELRGSAGAG